MHSLTMSSWGWQNALPFPANMAPGGGLHQVLPAKGGGHMVAPNHTVTYTWHVPLHSGPGPGDFSAVAYTYRSTTDITAHENAGLLGAVVIERPVRAQHIHWHSAFTALLCPQCFCSAGRAHTCNTGCHLQCPVGVLAFCTEEADWG